MKGGMKSMDKLWLSPNPAPEEVKGQGPPLPLSAADRPGWQEVKRLPGHVGQGSMCVLPTGAGEGSDWDSRAQWPSRRARLSAGSTGWAAGLPGGPAGVPEDHRQFYRRTGSGKQ